MGHCSIKGWLWGMMILAISVSCTRDKALNSVLDQAGKNRTELEKVLVHYDSIPEKKKAAEFLIRNMPGRYSMQSPFLFRYYELLDSLQGLNYIGHDEIIVFYDSIYKRSEWRSLKPVYDIESITSQYLITHIDAAFDAWKSPWAKDLTFEEFCEYLLPYRVDNEVLESWMEDYKAKYENIAYSVGSTSIDSVYEVFANMFVGHRYFAPDFVPGAKPSSLPKIRIGACRMYTALATCLFRSIGVPIVSEFTPNWSNHAMGHEWTTIIVKGKNYPIQLGDKGPLGYHIKGFTYRPPKIYRTTFGSHKALIEDETDVPPLFKDKRVIDVTHEYLPTTVIDLPESFKEYGNYRYAYLSVFDLMNWKPVAFGMRKGQTIQFQNMGLNAVYLPVFYKEGIYYPAYHPVRVDKEGDYLFLKPNKKKLRKVILRRKFMDNSPKQWADAMVGGCFVFSKEALFADGDTLRIDSLHEYAYQTMEIKGLYRYMKYIPPVFTKGNIAEIEVYDKQGTKVQGKVIGNYAPGWLDSMVAMRRAFDGDALTFTSARPEQEDAWLGLDFGKQVEVNKLVYLPRSDDNFIKEGELYELFYWDKEWRSLGQQTGSRQLQYLEYDNVPDNALLLLRNLTKGKEERIFTYEDGKLIWW